MTDLPPQRDHETAASPLLDELEADPGRLRTAVAWVQRTVTILAIVVLILGLLGLGLGIAALGSPAGTVIVILISLPALAGPLLALRRERLLAGAVTNPGEVLSQARDLLTVTKHRTQVNELTAKVRSLRSGGAKRSKGGRLRSGVAVARSASALVEAAGPDPDRHPRLLPFLPSNLLALWKWVLLACWGAVLSSVLIVVSLVMLALDVT